MCLFTQVSWAVFTKEPWKPMVSHTLLFNFVSYLMLLLSVVCATLHFEISFNFYDIHYTHIYINHIYFYTSQSCQAYIQAVLRLTNHKPRPNELSYSDHI